MVDGMGDLFNAAIGSGIGGGGMAVLARIWFSSVLSKNKALAEELADLKDNQIAKLEERVNEHLKADVTIQMSLTRLETKLSEIGGSVNRLSDGQSVIAQDVARLQSDARNNNDFIRNVDSSLKELRREIHAR